MNESINIVDDRKNMRKDRIKTELAQGVFKQQGNMILAIIFSIVFGFIFSFTLTAYYHLLNLFLALLVGLSFLDILIIRSKDYDTKNLVFWNIVIVVFTSIFYRTAISYYVAMASLAYPTLFVSLVIFSKKDTPLSAKRFIGQHFSFFANLGQIFKAISLTVSKKTIKGKNIGSILIGIVVAGFALLIILPIMGNADMFFKDSLSNLLDYSNDIEISEFVWKIILGAFFTLCGFGFIYTGIVKQYEANKAEKQISVSQVMIITILSIVGLAYLAFISTQVKHLFLSSPTGVLEGASYAEYARSGFFEMVWLCTINIFIILGCVFLSNDNKQYSKLLKSLMMYFNIINLYMLIVSFYKMYLYQSEFGFTEKRLLVYTYILFQLIVLALLTVKIFNRNFKFWLTVLYLSCVFWGVVSFINIQYISFELNVKRYEETGEIDTTYLSSYNDKSASNAVKDFYFEYKEALRESQLNDILIYYTATYGNEYQKYINDKNKINNLIKERFKTHDLLEVNIHNQKFTKDAELVLNDYYDEFVTE